MTLQVVRQLVLVIKSAATQMAEVEISCVLPLVSLQGKSVSTLEVTVAALELDTFLCMCCVQ